VKKSERQVGEYKRQLSMVKTTESVQKATSAITDNFSSSNSKLLNAKDSLERIKAKQQKFDDQMKAAEVLESENSDNSLAAQLKQAGIGGTDNSANSVLDRLKAKQK
jgi:phage shock protein A